MWYVTFITFTDTELVDGERNEFEVQGRNDVFDMKAYYDDFIM